MTQLRYSICLDSCCPKKDYAVALEEVKAAGFEYYEFWGGMNKDLKSIKAKADSLGLKIAHFGSRKTPGTLVNASDHDSFVNDMPEVIEAAKFMGINRMVTTAGNDNGMRRDFQHNNIVTVLKRVMPILEQNNFILDLEPLNGRKNHVGTFLESSDEAFAICDEVGSPNMRLLFDIYHQQITEGDILHRMIPRIKQIGHVHCAGSDNRNELDLGELNHRYIFKALAEAGYDGIVGLEYFPIGDSLTGLKRMYEYLHK